MKKILFALIILSTSIIWAYHIKSFDDQITINADASVLITENIKVDFDGESRHGIYRDIIYKYKTKYGNKYKLRIEIIDITDGNGRNRKYKVSKQGKNIHIRIGNSNKYVKGIQNYVITYKVLRATKFFDNHDELWWEVTGHNWEVPIHSTSVTVILPEKTDLDKVDGKCYTGKWGADAHDCQWTPTSNGLQFISGYLNPLEGLSIVVGIPKGIIGKPSAAQSFIWFIKDNWLWILCFPLPFIVFILLFTKWLRNGRDPMRGVSIMVRYEPPEDLTPAEMGTVIDERADISDITATIVDLAVRKYLKIVEVETKKLLFLKNRDYALVLLKNYEDADDLNSFEKKFLDYIFEVGENKDKTLEALGVPDGIKSIFISTLKNKFYSKLQLLKSKLYFTLVKRKYFPQNPEKVKSKYFGIGLFIIILGFVGSFVISNWAFLWAGIPSGILFFIFAPMMPRKTRKGAAAAIHAKGFEEFVRRAEKDRIKRLAKDDPTVFERLLPYAMVLGCADEWTEKFKDIFDQPPDWYVSQRPLTTYGFMSNLGSAMNSMNGAVTSHPRGSTASGGGSGFSGGGFSGGGFGGGGGGAW
ncbi:DUF2207 domain-containing protein [bacterium]|nr:DUF2207 domain-containing protein [bacterium]